MRVVFAGTTDFAAHCLAALLEAGHDVRLVLTRPDRPAGRGLKFREGEVKQLAQKRRLDVLQPDRLDDAQVRLRIKHAQPDIMIVVAYGMLIPAAILNIPPLGGVNVHASLLPRWRGAAPIERALLAGDAETGITLIKMDAGLDSGPILAQYPLAIDKEEIAQSLRDKLARLAAKMMVHKLTCLGVRVIAPAPQKLDDEAVVGMPQSTHGITYAPKLTKAEAQIDWEEPAEQIARKVRAFNPAPGAHARLGGQPWRIWQAHPCAGQGRPGEIIRIEAEGMVVACGRDALLIEEMQKAGSVRMKTAEYLRGHPVKSGAAFDRSG
jgi:methionyl-tRNA formyltransferase